MDNLHSYDNPVAAMNDLQSRGFNLDFNVVFDQLISKSNKQKLKPEDFEITEAYRFEGDTNPSDEEVVYAIESRDGKMKGIFTAAFGAYTDEATEIILKKLTMHLSGGQ